MNKREVVKLIREMLSSSDANCLALVESYQADLRKNEAAVALSEARKRLADALLKPVVFNGVIYDRSWSDSRHWLEMQNVVILDRPTRKAKNQ